MLAFNNVDHIFWDNARPEQRMHNYKNTRNTPFVTYIRQFKSFIQCFVLFSIVISIHIYISYFA